MKKNIFVLILVLLSPFGVFSQKVRTTAVFDADTTTRPKSGFTGIGFRNGRLFAVPFSGTNYRIINANTHVGANGQVLFTNGTSNYFKTLGLSDVGVSGLTTNYLVKWNGSDFVNSNVFTDNTTLSSNSPLFLVGGSFPLIKLNGSQSGSVLYSIRSYIVGLSNGGFEIYDDTNSQPRLTITPAGNVGIGSNNPTSKLQVVGLPTYADNAAASSGGLTAGAFYRTSTGVLMVVY